jgi:hypothetical protein
LIPFDSLRKRRLAMMGEILRWVDPSSTLSGHAFARLLNKNYIGGYNEIQPNPLLVDRDRPWLGL